MRQALAMLVIFAGANLVAAGVVAVLGPRALELPEEIMVVGILATFVTAIGCALLFIRGAIQAARDQLRYPRQRGG